MKIKKMNILHFLNENGLSSKQLVLSFIIAFFLGLFIPAIGATENNIDFDFTLTGADENSDCHDKMLAGGYDCQTDQLGQIIILEASLDGKEIFGSLCVCVEYTTDASALTRHFLEPIWRIDAYDGPWVQEGHSFMVGEASGIIFGIQVEWPTMTARLARDGVVTAAGGVFEEQLGNRVHSLADVEVDLLNGEVEVKGKTYIVNDSKWLEENRLCY